MNGKIFLENSDNSVTGIYVHKINENATNILKTFFNTEEKIKNLISNGPIYTLAESNGPIYGPIYSLTESNIISIEGVGSFFREEYRSADVARKNSSIGRTYVFSSGVWMVSDNGLPYVPA